LLYVTDLCESDSPCGFLKGILPLKKKMFDNFVIALSPSLKGRMDCFSDPEIQFKTKRIGDYSYREIMTAAKDALVSCIVVDLDRDSHGATLRELVAKSPLPVLVLNRGHSSGEVDLPSHVIFATDWSPASEKAMEQILAISECIYELDIIHVISEKLTVKDMRDLKERLGHTRQICLDEGINAESHIYAGNVAEEIVTASEDYRGTMIAVGSGTEKSFLKRLFKRDKVYNIVENATVPVFFVPVAAWTSRD